MIVGRYHYPRTDVVRFDRPWHEAVPDEMRRLGAGRAVVVASRSLLASRDFRRRLETALGPALAGIADGIGVHTPVPDAVALARLASETRADVLVAIGGGSVVDGAKVASLALARGIFDARALVASRTAKGAPPLPARTIAVPTTLSGAEFTAFAGASDPDRNVKEAYAHPDMMPVATILDPALATGTPETLWLSTGIRAVDHAVEDLCSVNRHALSDAASIHALKLLVPSLRRTKDDPADVTARLDSMQGVWLSLIGTQGGVEKGASHAIGHILGGSAGVPHGVTSCVMLPHVLRWNAPVNADRQRIVSDAMGAAERPAADLVAELISDLGLPNRLRDVGVRRDDLERLAELTMADPWTPTNPRPVGGPADIRTILDAAW